MVLKVFIRPYQLGILYIYVTLMRVQGTWAKHDHDYPVGNAATATAAALINMRHKIMIDQPCA